MLDLNEILDAISPETAISRRDETIRELREEVQRLEQEVDRLESIVVAHNKMICTTQAKRQTAGTWH